MIVVAICALATSVDDEVPHFARASKLAPYDARMKLAQPAPAIVLRTPDREIALAMLASLRSRGHDAVACDEAALVTPAPVRMLRFADSLEHDGSSTPYPEIVALVRAVRATRMETTERVTERKFRPGAALVTGGLILSKKVTRDEKRIAHDKEEVLYVFARAGAAPLALTERGTSYAALDDVAKSQRENFLRVVAMLRERAPAALYDERLLALRAIVDASEIELRAQLLAASLSRNRPER